MRRLSLFATAAVFAASAFAASSPAEAAYHLIRWEDSGFCQIWDENVPTSPWPANYTIVSEQLPTFGDALVYKDGLLRSGMCAF
jgi:hypothetical protein